MWAMSEHAGPPPEGALITAALKRRRLSARAAAPKAGISETRWRQITSGYQTVSSQRIPVRAPDDTLARMAQVAGVTPEELIEADRPDAAEELRGLPPLEEPTADEPTVAELAAQLAEEKKRRADLERRFDEYLARQEEERQRHGKSG
jgi:transcriptional regulator with XRE-family HTH domain